MITVATVTNRNDQLRLEVLTGEMVGRQYATSAKVWKQAVNIAQAIPTAQGKEKGPGVRYLRPLIIMGINTGR